MIEQKIAVTVDSVVFYVKDNLIKVLLIKRKNDPYKDEWALPGGFLEEDESLEAGARRELEEETGLNIEKMQQVKAFGEVNRDPRGRTISIAFAAKTTEESRVKAADDASEAKWFHVNELPPLAFDHIEIIQAARSLL